MGCLHRQYLPDGSYDLEAKVGACLSGSRPPDMYQAIPLGIASAELPLITQERAKMCYSTSINNVSSLAKSWEELKDFAPPAYLLERHSFNNCEHCSKSATIKEAFWQTQRC